MIECDWRTSVDDERCVTAVPDCVVCVCACRFQLTIEQSRQRR